MDHESNPPTAGYVRRSGSNPSSPAASSDADPLDWDEGTVESKYRSLLPKGYVSSLSVTSNTLGFERHLKSSVQTPPKVKHKLMGNKTVTATSYSTFRGVDRLPKDHTRKLHLPRMGKAKAHAAVTSHSADSIRSKDFIESCVGEWTTGKFGAGLNERQTKLLQLDCKTRLL